MPSNPQRLGRRTGLKSDLRRKQQKMLLRQPALLAVILAILALLLIFIVYPILRIVGISLSTQEGLTGLEAWKQVLGDPHFQATFWNSIRLAAVVSVLSTAVGYVFAYALTRTNMRCKGFFHSITTLPIISPPFVLSLSLIFLFGRQGLITNRLLGIRNFDVYGFGSLVLIQTITFFPVALLTLSGMLESIDSSVEDAALNMGAGRGHIFWTVTLPLSVPGIISSLLLVFIQSLEDFSNPAVIAGDYSTLAVEAYRLITGMYDTRGGAIYAIVLLLPILTVFLLKRYWLEGKSFVTVTGKPTQQRKELREPYIVWPLAAFCWAVVSVIVLLYGTVLFGAFVRVWGINYSLTLDHFSEAMAFGWDALKNTLVLALAAMPIAGVLGMVIAYLTVRKEFIGKRFMSFTSMLNFAIPGTVIGIGFVLAFNTPPLELTGTAFILVVMFVFRNMSVGIESATSTLMQIDPSIEEASTILGAASGRTFWKITLPLIRPTFYSGLIYAFVRSMTAVSAVIFLVSPKWDLATRRVFSLFEVSRYSTAAAYIIMMTITILVVIGCVNLLVMRPGKFGRRKGS